MTVGSTMLNIQSLFASLVGQGLEKAASAKPNPELAGAPTTIRLSPEARAFFTAQAEAFGHISMSAFIAMTLEGVMHSTKGSDQLRPQEQLQRRIELSRDRLLHLFLAHGIQAHEIASLLDDSSITTATLHDPNAFIAKLDDHLVQRVASQFQVSRDWLAGKSDQCVETASGRWYKNTDGAIAALVRMLKEGLRPEVLVIRSSQADFQRAYAGGDAAPWADVGIIIRTERETPAGINYSVYEMWDFERWNYEKCRHYLKALFLWLSRQSENVSFHGRIRLLGRAMEPDLIKRLKYGQILPVEAIRLSVGKGEVWYPDDYVDSKLSLEADELALVQKYFYEERNLDAYFAELASTT